MHEEIPIPSVDIQERIAALLEREHEVARVVQRTVKKIGEYRIRIVSDIVTGKLDVREAAARLPEEAPRDAIDDDTDLGDDPDADAEEAIA